MKRGLSDSTLRAYLSDIAVSGDNNFGDAYKFRLSTGAAAHFGATGTWFGVIPDDTGFTGPFKAGKKSLIFPVSNQAVSEKGFRKAPNLFSNYSVQKQTSITIAAGASQGTHTEIYNNFITPSNDDQFLVVYGNSTDTNIGQDLIGSNNYDIEVNNTGETNSLTLKFVDNTTAPAGGSTASIIYPVQYEGAASPNNNHRTLTMTTPTTEDSTSTSQVHEQGITWNVYQLKNSDVFSVNSVVRASNSSEVSSDKFRLDNGNREGAILRGKIFVNESEVPGGSDDVF